MSECPVPGMGSSSSSSGPVAGSESPAPKAGESACPVSEEDRLAYNNAANDMTFNDKKITGQTIDMSKTRSLSGIPKSAHTPKHQPGGIDKWVYPSEQQYYNAMKRKGYDPPERDVSAILAIHNSVNEQGWSKIQEWEKFRGCMNPKLIRFMGKPTELSPKAKFLTWIGMAPPFDRHDWVVERDGKEVRYVIDFYHVPDKTGRQIAANLPVHLDVRPALDSINAFTDRLLWRFKK